MAALSPAAANGAAGAAWLQTKMIQFGETVTQGMPVYKSTSDSKYYKADADTLAAAKAEAIALTPGTADSYGLIALPSNTPGLALVNVGATLTAGQVYVVSTTAGGIAPYSDLASGDYVTILGVATTTALLDLRCIVSNTAKP